MSASVLYRIAAALFVLFAAGHTVGFLRFKPATVEALAVRDGMNDVRFEVGQRAFTYGGFYRGFGLFITAFLLFSAYLAWHLAGMAARAPQSIGSLAWAFFAVQVASLVLSAMYFFPVSAVFSGAVAVCLGAAAWLIR